mmetsp:Transcript_47965/g.121790  ORF Transcript_47965/g.121790 Transcript_47965/m.121790 type:complete len:517 (+) Transcript_47965:134-1684(+)
MGESLSTQDMSTALGNPDDEAARSPPSLRDLRAEAAHSMSTMGDPVDEARAASPQPQVGGKLAAAQPLQREQEEAMSAGATEEDLVEKVEVLQAPETTAVGETERTEGQMAEKRGAEVQMQPAGEGSEREDGKYEERKKESRMEKHEEQEEREEREEEKAKQEATVEVSVTKAEERPEAKQAVVIVADVEEQAEKQALPTSSAAKMPSAAAGSPVLRATSPPTSWSPSFSAARPPFEPPSLEPSSGRAGQVASRPSESSGFSAEGGTAAAAVEEHPRKAVRRRRRTGKGADVATPPPNTTAPGGAPAPAAGTWAMAGLPINAPIDVPADENIVGDIPASEFVPAADISAAQVAAAAEESAAASAASAAAAAAAWDGNGTAYSDMITAYGDPAAWDLTMALEANAAPMPPRCRHWQRGRCHLGDRCNFYHGPIAECPHLLVMPASIAEPAPGLESDSPRASILTLCGAWGALVTRKPLSREELLRARGRVLQKPAPTRELRKFRCVREDEIVPVSID